MPRATRLRHPSRTEISADASAALTVNLLLDMDLHLAWSSVRLDTACDLEQPCAGAVDHDLVHAARKPQGPAGGGRLHRHDRLERGVENASRRPRLTHDDTHRIMWRGCADCRTPRRRRDDVEGIRRIHVWHLGDVVFV